MSLGIDERLGLLVRSTESLHESVFENTKQIAELRELVRKHESRWELLGRAMLGAIQAGLEGEDSQAS